MPKSRTTKYPKPGPTGGKLIRSVIAAMRESGPPDAAPTSHILIAASGGPDSTALAHLIARYGRKIAKKSEIRLLHINHGWRGAESDQDARFVRKLARELGVKVTIKKIRPPEPGSGESWENLARLSRKRIFRAEAKRRNAIVLTAHHADDVAETVLWKILTGQARTHSGGILARHGAEIRPCLGVRKSELKNYLREEKQDWREDSTNLIGRFLRARLRLELMPIVEHLFPKAVAHLCDIAKGSLESRSRNANRAFEAPSSLPSLLFGAAGLRARKPHWDFLEAKLARKNWSGQLDLPGGWSLTRRLKGPERWVLEKR